MPSRAALFDFDGTLADTAPDLAAAVNRMRVEQGQAALPIERLRPFASAGARGGGGRPPPPAAPRGGGRGGGASQGAGAGARGCAAPPARGRAGGPAAPRAPAEAK